MTSIDTIIITTHPEVSAAEVDLELINNLPRCFGYICPTWSCTRAYTSSLLKETSKAKTSLTYNMPGTAAAVRGRIAGGLNRKDRAICRRLYRQHHCLTKDLAKIFSVTDATMRRVVNNDYVRSDNLDSDSEYILYDDVSRKTKQLDGLPKTRRTASAAARKQNKPTSGCVNLPGSSNQVHPATQKAPIEKIPRAVTESVSPPASLTRTTELLPNYPTNKTKIVLFLGNLGFADIHISTILPLLEEGGITDDAMFKQIFTWPECDVDQLMKELESNKCLTTVQRIRFRRGLHDRRNEKGDASS
ncbi:hypothetical protein BDN67DRAFT_1004088 [Paxillus ammoniavirescens]|nr:hypothetical protein BDN67DRAFT_1004088 [Paxillus ammoniavirescens]